ncbi:type IV toxin-antitoxin system AbiEi family antitoxin domain-containing protein [Trueperella bernardiae]|uniref:type IV toxin-antitoxin system AbiEi family antitoxin domain-containing protein n=1 Tax=Trueperella bernardiae TaxID=59561 RepID=UPI002556CC51|nr:type IV toxin-antitoxin system AbiEi family antitoxin domain-containing protein [Trueperella bernardiae]WIM07647.1 type IV toxin-antitoxin system AbiEi family antitoxin domain-containing protein [Trueperella bernardiae]
MLNNTPSERGGALRRAAPPATDEPAWLTNPPKIFDPPDWHVPPEDWYPEQENKSPLWTPQSARKEFGLVTQADLKTMGYTSHYAISKAVKAGRFQRLRHGVYALPRADPDAIRAVKLGGAIACESACRRYGIWVPHQGLHMAVQRNQTTSRPQGVTIHSQRDAPSLIPTPREAVAQVLRFHDAETGLMALESALNKGLIEMVEVGNLIQDLSVNKQAVLRRASPFSESGLETRVRLFLLSNRVHVQPQVYIPSVGRVDMVAGSSLILECNGDLAHSTKEQRNRDYIRIQNARLLGYDTVSLSYAQIFWQWEETQGYLLALIRQRRHLKPPIPLRR